MSIVESNNETNIAYVEGSAAVLYNDKIYFSTFNPIGCLYCFDIKTGTTTFLKQLTIENSRGMCYLKAVLYGNEAWFIPWDAHRLLCVNLDNLEEEYFEIKGHDYASGNSFVDCLFYGDGNLLLIPCGTTLDTMVMLNLKEHMIEQVQQVIPSRKCIGAYLWEDKLHFISAAGTELSIFDLKKRKIQFLSDKKDTRDCKYSSIVQDKEIVYLIPRESEEIGIIQLDTNEQCKITLPIPGDSFFGGFCIPDGLLMYNFRTMLDISFWNEDENDRKWTRCVKVNKKLRIAEVAFFPRGGTKRVEQYMTEISSPMEIHMVLSNDGNLFLLDEYGNIKKTWTYSTEIASNLSIPKIDRHITMKDIKRRNPELSMENTTLRLKDFVLALAREK